MSCLDKLTPIYAEISVIHCVAVLSIATAATPCAGGKYDTLGIAHSCMESVDCKVAEWDRSMCLGSACWCGTGIPQRDGFPVAYPSPVP